MSDREPKHQQHNITLESICSVSLSTVINTIYTSYDIATNQQQVQAASLHAHESEGSAKKGYASNQIAHSQTNRRSLDTKEQLANDTSHYRLIRSMAPNINSKTSS